MKNLLQHSTFVFLLFWYAGAGAQTPAFTKPTSFNDVKVYRLQIILKTADVKDAGTDDFIYVKFNSGMEPYYLNKSGDDFERNSTGVYDVIDPSVVLIRDIRDFTIAKLGTDGWSPVLVQIKVNNAVIFEKTLSNHWIDGNDGKRPDITFASSEMRNAGKWNYNGANASIYIPPRILKKADLINIVETAVGNSMRYSGENSLGWGDLDGKNTLFGDAVEASFRNNKTLAFDLDLEWDFTALPDEERDIDFDLVISCNNGNVKLAVQGQDVGDASMIKVGNICNYLNRTFNVANCTAHFESNGDLFYY